MARLLLVEDHADSRELATAMLEMCGHDVVAVDSAEEALRVGPDAFDLILSDLDLPGLGGADFKRILDARGYAVPVIVVSGHAEALRIAAEVGALTTVPKPVEFARLAAALAAARLPSSKGLARP